ncbi:MAG TPA: hypothetical protein VM491_13165 [Burkholderiaceae bacterium]|nr:hypothetical protein [Burkholderiaceae bacterium]
MPIGGGLGGGSSDAATTLLACNRLWEAGCTREQLAQLALQLWADVPFFVFGRNAYATGIGEALQPLQLPAQSFVVVAPPATVATRDIFADPDLTRETKPFKIDGLWRGRLGIYSGRNDLEPVVVRRFPAVAAALAALKESAVAAGMDPALVRMSGSGACVFAPAPSASLAERIAMDVLRCQVGTVRVADGLFEHPLGSRQVG